MPNWTDKPAYKNADHLLCEVQNEATLSSRKSVNVPGVRINLPSLTEKDRNNILYATAADAVWMPTALRRTFRISKLAPGW